MVKRVVGAGLVFLFALISGPSVVAQGTHIVVTGIGGYTFAEGAKGKDFHAGNGQIYNRADPADSGHFGFSVGVAEGHGEYGFLYRYNPSQLQVSGSATTTIGDMAISNYHGYLSYYFGDPDGRMHYYVTAGAGASHFSKVTFTPAGGSATSIGGRTEFSATFGAGIRAMLSDRFGLRFGVQFTPIYLTADPGTQWCDPYWGCYLVGNNQYANQVDVTAGVTFRFK